VDLLTYWRVIQRQRRIVVVGFVLTLLAAAFLLFSFSTSGVGFRTPPVYFAKANLFVTQSGFPWGRSALTEYVRAQGAGDEDVAVPRFADPTRMEYLANLYSELALSDDVRRIVRRDGFRLRDLEEYRAVPLTATDGRPLPIIEVSGTSESQARAVFIANRVAGALQRFVAGQQRQSGISDDTRIVLPVITRADEAEVLQGVKLTSAVMIGLLGLIATLFVAFIVDNVQRQRLLTEEVAESAPEPEASVRHLPPSEPASTQGSKAARRSSSART
jgi:hypothetical protein